MYTGIEFNGAHSYRDMRLTIEDRNIGNPSKIKRKERVPYSNTYYDFSTLYGGQEYTERELTYVFNIMDYERKNFYIFETEINNWLMQVNQKSVLKDDLIPGYYLLAEVEDETVNQKEFEGGRLTVHFTAYSFKISELYEGNDIWDTFNFLLDYAQDTKFEVNGMKEVTLYNPSATTIIPEIITTNEMIIKRDNTQYVIPQGTTKSHDFILYQDENKLTIEGNGTIEFKFRKELI